MEATRNDLKQKIYKELIPLCCNGNKDAEEYLRRLFFIVRTMDDVYDEDKKVGKDDIIDSFFLFFGDIATNKFYQEHQEKLTAIHIVAFNAWQDANDWEKDTDSLKQLYAHVLRDYVCDVFAFTAYLTGGRHSMRKLSPIVRTAFLKEIGM
jgi:hypothetical protein